MTLEKLIFALASFLPLFYVFNFWLYKTEVYQHNYFYLRKYMTSKYGKRVIFNFWFLIIAPLFLLNFGIFFDRGLEFIVFPVVYYMFLLYNIFVLGKIFRKKIRSPEKNRKNFAIKSAFVFTLLGANIYFIRNDECWYYIYSLYLGFLVFVPMFFLGFLKVKSVVRAEIVEEEAKWENTDI